VRAGDPAASPPPGNGETRPALAIPLVALDEVPESTWPSAAPTGWIRKGGLIKGRRALLREKVVATSAARAVILVGAEKCVPRLGTRGRLPIEVLPFAWASVRHRLEALGVPGAPRLRDGRFETSDNGNALVDCRVRPLADPAELDRALRSPGCWRRVSSWTCARRS
jgi:ribose 5-phosphate isomerase A